MRHSDYQRSQWRPVETVDARFPPNGKHNVRPFKHQESNRGRSLTRRPNTSHHQARKMRSSSFDSVTTTESSVYLNKPRSEQPSAYLNKRRPGGSFDEATIWSDGSESYDSYNSESTDGWLYEVLTCGIPADRAYMNRRQRFRPLPPRASTRSLGYGYQRSQSFPRPGPPMSVMSGSRAHPSQFPGDRYHPMPAPKHGRPMPMPHMAAPRPVPSMPMRTSHQMPAIPNNSPMFRGAMPPAPQRRNIQKADARQERSGKREVDMSVYSSALRQMSDLAIDRSTSKNYSPRQALERYSGSKQSTQGQGQAMPHGLSTRGKKYYNTAMRKDGKGKEAEMEAPAFKARPAPPRTPPKIPVRGQNPTYMRSKSSSR